MKLLNFPQRGSQARHWFTIYIGLPLAFVIGELAIRAVVALEKASVDEIAPFTSLMVSMILVSIFVRDEVSEHKVLDPEASDLGEHNNHKALMSIYTFILTIVFAALVIFETMYNTRGDTGYYVQLCITRVLAIVGATAFLRQVMISQGRFKLRAG